MISVATLALIATSAAAAPSWACTASYDGFIPVRIDGEGDVQCWSNDGANCLVHWEAEGCNALINNATVAQPSNPLSCGCMHKALYSGGGYSQWGDNYWCVKGKQLLNANPPNPECAATTGWKCTNFYGASTPVRLDAKGDVQCWSDTTMDCYRFDTTDECDAFVKGTTSKPRAPWSCGCGHRAVEWTDGYTMNGNEYWCATGKLLLNANPPNSDNCTPEN